MEYLERLHQYTAGKNQIDIQYAESREHDKNCMHYVLWSGGYDSTLLLYELLQTYGCDNVVAVSYKYPWLYQSKYETERLHREAFKAKMKLRGFPYIRHSEFDITHSTISGDPINIAPGGTPQAIAWILSIPLYTVSTNFIYTGYIKEDDLSLILHEYYQLFQNISNVLERDITLRIPYLLLSKHNILEKMIQYDLYEEAWYCEMPPDVNKQCYKCDPCKHHIAALNTLRMFTEDELVQLKAAGIMNTIAASLKKPGSCSNSSDVVIDNILSGGGIIQNE